jgi:hypothetical protein
MIFAPLKKVDFGRPVVLLRLSVMDKQTLIAGIIAMCGTAVLISCKQVLINGFWWLIRIATTTVEIANTHVVFYVGSFRI